MSSRSVKPDVARLMRVVGAVGGEHTGVEREGGIPGSSLVEMLEGVGERRIRNVDRNGVIEHRG